MAITSPYADMNPLATDSTNVSLVKIDSALRELATANTGATGVQLASSAGTAEKSRVAKTSAGRLVRAGATNLTASARYLQIFDATALPANGAIPLVSMSVPVNDYKDINFDRHGLPFTSGLVAALSSTQTSLTIVTANDALFVVTYF